MTSVPDNVLQSLAAMTGYERMLEIDRIAGSYGVTPDWIEQQIRPSTQANQAQSDPHQFAPSTKETPTLPSSPSLIDKQNLRFEYDPSAEAAQRRERVEQAILCPSCGAALGIPSVRPIKVTCPQCLQETIFES